MTRSAKQNKTNRTVSTSVKYHYIPTVLCSSLIGTRWCSMTMKLSWCSINEKMARNETELNSCSWTCWTSTMNLKLQESLSCSARTHWSRRSRRPWAHQGTLVHEVAHNPALLLLAALGMVTYHMVCYRLSRFWPLIIVEKTLTLTMTLRLDYISDGATMIMIHDSWLLLLMNRTTNA